ncbi:ABC-three component system middle component 1 [Stenotrophomonas nitritireducens]|uniref:ABC-three component system middle component 1 n=1 Tax=Stenotrophomonas nitritireducens TaxID=83617 RepID=UPI003D95F585
MNIDSFVLAISNRAQGRFAFNEAEVSLDSIVDTPGNIRLSQRVCRLRREGMESGWRTILIAELDFVDDGVQAAYAWAADVREHMAEPETADLYLFLLIRGIPDEEAARIETDDSFCRKFVWRTKESAVDMLDRTFLARPLNDDSSGDFSDPLQTALGAVATDHPWTRAHLSVWRDLLVSGKAGAELAQALSSTLSTNRERQP